MENKRRCEVCGAEFVPANSRILCCGRECSRRLHDMRKQSRLHERRVSEGTDGRRIGILRTVGTCLVCGKTIEGFRSTRKYCDSERCRKIGLLMQKHGMTAAEAGRMYDEREREKAERAATKERSRRDRPKYVSVKDCIYYGKSLPPFPQTLWMSQECQKSGMDNVCKLKGRCPMRG